MILLDNCERQFFANAAFAFVADCEDVDSSHCFLKNVDNMINQFCGQ
jgi:hypothetical protein